MAKFGGQQISDVRRINGVLQFPQTLEGRIDNHNIVSGNITLPITISKGDTLPYKANTTEYWNTYQIKSQRDVLYVYLDYVSYEGEPTSVAFKYGDGISNVRDLPFCNKNVDYEEHIRNDEIHVTPEEKEYWNNKERAILDNGKLVFIK